MGINFAKDSCELVGLTDEITSGNTPGFVQASMVGFVGKNMKFPHQYVYLHLVDFFMGHISKYTGPIESYGNASFFFQSRSNGQEHGFSMVEALHGIPWLYGLCESWYFGPK